MVVPKPTQKPNGREEMFLRNYLKSFDPAGAFTAAGLKSKAKGGEAAAAQALLVKFQHLLVDYNQQQLEADRVVEVTGDRVVEELAALGFSTIATACTWTQKTITLVDANSLSTQQLATIKKIQIKPTEFGPDISVEMHDKIGSLKILAKYLNVDCSINELIQRVQSFGFDVSDKRS
jgi:Terminase small subunit